MTEMTNDKEMEERIAKEMTDAPEDIFQDELVKHYQNEFLDEELISSFDEALKELKEPVLDLDDVYPLKSNDEKARAMSSEQALADELTPPLSVPEAENPVPEIVETITSTRQVSNPVEEIKSSALPGHFSSLWNLLVFALIVVLGWQYYESSSTIKTLENQLNQTGMAVLTPETSTQAKVMKAEIEPLSLSSQDLIAGEESDGEKHEEIANSSTDTASSAEQVITSKISEQDLVTEETSQPPQSLNQSEIVEQALSPNQAEEDDQQSAAQREVEQQASESQIAEEQAAEQQVAESQIAEEASQEDISTKRNQASVNDRGKWVINLLSYKTRFHAEEAADELMSLGVDNIEVIHTVTPKGRNWYRVRIYGFNTYVSARDYFHSNKKRLHANSPWIDLYEKK